MVTLLPAVWQPSGMASRATSIPPPPPINVDPGVRFSLCGEALGPFLASVMAEAQDAGWHEREVVVAVMTWAASRAAMIDGGDAISEALVLSLKAARAQGG